MLGVNVQVTSWIPSYPDGDLPV